jgi:spore maturation protein CgeB
MKVLCAFGKYQYGDPRRGVGIEYESFIPAMKRLGHEVRHFETWDPVLYPQYADLNRALLGEVTTYQPDLVFTVQRDYEIWIDTLNEIRRQSDAALVTWTTDDSFKFHQVSKYIGSYYDAISTTYDYRVHDYKKAGIEGVYSTQWAANSHWLMPPKRAQDCKYSVSFIGASYGARAAMIERMRLAGIRVECFGFGWPNGSIPTDQIPIVMRDSIISLNFSSGFMGTKGHDMQIKARIFEVPGAGGFLLTDVAPGLDTVYEIGQEIETYCDFDELVRKILYYLHHFDDRDKIAHAGYQRTVAHHVYERRLEGLLRFAVDRRDARAERGSGGALATGESAAEASFPSTPGAGLLLLRWILVTGCTLIWDAKRAPKAARRLTFDVSRRVYGVKTFGSMSIPARLFPYV